MNGLIIRNTQSIPPHSLNVPYTLAIVGRSMALTIVADDLTGACDAETLFARRAPVPVTIWPDPPAAAEVAVVDTESRHLAADEANPHAGEDGLFGDEERPRSSRRSRRRARRA